MIVAGCDPEAVAARSRPVGSLGERQQAKPNTDRNPEPFDLQERRAGPTRPFGLVTPTYNLLILDTMSASGLRSQTS